MDFPVINLWAVLVRGMASLIIGGIWYAPFIFGKKWQEEVAHQQQIPYHSSNISGC